MTTLDFDNVLSMISDSYAAGIMIDSEYQSSTMTLTPPAGTVGKTSEQGFFRLPDGTFGVTIDSWGSQARRWNLALEKNQDQLPIPRIEFFADGLPLNSSYTWSHKHADAIFRMNVAELEAAGVPATELLNATPENADALLQWMPNAIVNGWWNSHGGGAQKNDPTTAKALKLPDLTRFSGSANAVKSARAMVCEIIATNVALRTRYAARIDSVFGPMPTIGKSKYSSLGFGSIPPSAAPKDVTFENIKGNAWISFTRLRAYRFERFDNDRARAAMVVLALLGLQLGANDLHLRSGTDLIRRDKQAYIYIHDTNPVPCTIPSADELTNTLDELAKEFEWIKAKVDLNQSKNLKHLLKASDNVASGEAKTEGDA